MKPPIRRLFTPRLAALSGPSMQRVGPTTHLHDMGNYQGIGKPGEGILLQVDYSRATLSPSRYSSFASAPTHARASTATVRDYSGKVLDCRDSEIRFEGAYRTFVNDGAEHGAGVVGVKYITDYYSPTERTTALTPSDAGSGDYFGFSCALSADASVLAVGASEWDGGAGGGQGAVYVFDWNGSAWVERTTALTPSDAGVGDRFGNSCALSADASVLAVGAYAWDGGAGNDQGAIYVFDWNGSAWVERTTALVPSDAGVGDRFGASCALSADASVLAVGAYEWDGGAGGGQGAVYVFDWNGSAWVERTTALTPSDAGVGDRFGFSCALSADASVLAVGAREWAGGTGGGQGAVYVFDWSGSAWVERTTALVPSDAGSGDYFGNSCALSADASVLAVGAYAWDGGAGNDQGAIYVLAWSGSAWVERTTALTPSDAGVGDRFGASCALSADASVLAVGAYEWDGGAGGGQGAVYVFDGVTTAYPITTPITFLKEDAATNLMEYSEDFELNYNVDVGANQCVFGSKAEESPDGRNTGNILIDDSATVILYCQKNIPITPGATYTNSLYLKKEVAYQGSDLYLRLRAGVGGTELYNDLTINATTGVITQVAGGDGAYGIESVGDWWRVYQTVTDPDDGNAFIILHVKPAVSPGVEGGVALQATRTTWGSQLTMDSKMGSHIPTSGAAATRAADVLSYSNVPAVNETRVEIKGKADSDTDDWDGTVDETGNLEILTVYGTGMRP